MVAGKACLSLLFSLWAFIFPCGQRPQQLLTKQKRGWLKSKLAIPTLCHEVEEKDVVLGMQSPKKRSLLDVNEHFEGEHNDKIHFLFSLRE